ncbi:MAG: UDP-N-acetylmuramoyl-tripeptide--D-alanyl-D-alanine ligase [Epulopiscium sp.]|nr:UDP-N-acetylmuramoyl-tripeptide--D-alanyl-D-alanine ligase [Candidatus Epulonipiscium sp.]
MVAIKLSEIVTAVNGRLILNDNLENAGDIIIKEIATDTRKISEGDLFVALSGEKFDGHNFIPQAFDKGAKICISNREDVIVPNDKGLIVVEDTKEALMDLAAFYRSLFPIPVIAITGSVGKTSTKDMIASVIGERYNILKTQGNFNNEIGVPLTVFRLNGHHEAAIIEMGMNHFGEIHNLSRIAKPDIAIITNIGVSHIENLGSREGILKAKSEIFDYVPKEGIAVLNGDDNLLINLNSKSPFNTIYFGLGTHNNIYAKDIHQKGITGIDAVVVFDNQEIPIHIPSPGKHMVYNALVAFAIGLKLGLTIQEIINGLLKYKASGMRMDISKTKKGIYIIDDAYNASPQSMKAAIDVLSESNEGKRKIAILGDMLEMGSFSSQAHEEVGKYVAKRDIDYLFCIGNEAKHIIRGAIDDGMSNNKVKMFSTQQELWRYLEDFIAYQDMVLFKASRGIHLEETVEKLKEVK